MNNCAVRFLVWSGRFALGLCLSFLIPISASEPDTPIPARYRIEPLPWPETDRSDEVGQRLLRLLNLQAERSLRWVEQERAASGLGAEPFAQQDVKSEPTPQSQGQIDLGLDSITVI